MATRVRTHGIIKARHLEIDIPMPLYERLEKALGDVIEKGLLPASTGTRDFIVSTVLVNGLALVEADLKKRERATNLILTPEQAAANWEQLRKEQKIGARHVG